MTVAKVVDASALAALIFAEPEGQEIAARLETATLVAPALLAFEMANVCLKKLRQDPARHASLLEAFALQVGLTIDIQDIDHVQVLALAERWRLTSYDASYLWLARELDVELVTLDRQLARAAAALAHT